MADLSAALPLIGNDFAPLIKKYLPGRQAAKIARPAPAEPILREIPRPAPSPQLQAPTLLVPHVAAHTKARRRSLSIHITLLKLIVFSVVIAAGAIVGIGLLTHAKLSSASLGKNATLDTTMVVNTSNLKAELSKVEQQTVTFTAGGSTVSATPSDITSWLTVASNPTVQTTTIGLSLPKISSYLDNLAKQYSVAPVAPLTVTHPDGTTATLTQGADGFNIGSTARASSQITHGLLGGSGLKVNLPGTVVPFTTSTTQAVAKLLEIDPTTKRMYAYDNGTLTKTFLVSAGAAATPTPIGQFKIWEKLPVQTMTGYNPNGTRYVQPNVQWVNYFDHSGDAVHGNYWRPASVFGSVNTSHGCVGVVNSDAEWIYNWAPIGTTVIIHD